MQAFILVVTVVVKEKVMTRKPKNRTNLSNDDAHTDIYRVGYSIKGWTIIMKLNSPL